MDVETDAGKWNNEHGQRKKTLLTSTSSINKKHQQVVLTDRQTEQRDMIASYLVPASPVMHT